MKRPAGQTIHAPHRRTAVGALLFVALLFGCRTPQGICARCFRRQIASATNAPTDAPTRTGQPRDASDKAVRDPQVVPVSWQDDARTDEARLKPPREPFEVPRELPGAETPPLHLPSHRTNESDGPDEERQQAISRLYAPLPTLNRGPGWREEPTGPLTLQSLEQMALDNSPVIREAAADIKAARGAAFQAGTYPNPDAGYEADTVNTGNTNGYHGAYIQQTFITAGKLRLASSALSKDVDNAILNLRKTRITVLSQVRSQYFAAIVAREKLKLARALSAFTEKLYQAQIDLVEGGEARPTNRCSCVSSRFKLALVAQAQQQQMSAWRQLAAALGLPAMPPTELAGRPDVPVPLLAYERALDQMLSVNTDLGVAENNVVQAQLLLRLAKVTPVPDVDLNFVLQRDYTFSPGTTTYNLNLGGEIPVFNQNRGNIVTAHAELYRANQAIAQVRNDLSGQLGEAFARYEASRVLVESFRAEALRDQVRTYRGIYERYRNDPENIEFNDVVVAQQTLAVTLNQYIDVLGNQWQAVVDVAQLLQVDDIFLMGDAAPVAAIPAVDAADVEELPAPKTERL